VGSGRRPARGGGRPRPCRGDAGAGTRATGRRPLHGAPDGAGAPHEVRGSLARRVLGPACALRAFPGVLRPQSLDRPAGGSGSPVGGPRHRRRLRPAPPLGRAARGRRGRLTGSLSASTFPRRAGPSAPLPIGAPPRERAEPRHRRVAGEGPHDRALPRSGLHRAGLLRPRPRPAALELRDRHRRGRRRLQPRLRDPRALGQARGGAAQGREPPTPSGSPPTSTARARRSPGTWPRCSASMSPPPTASRSTRSPNPPSGPRSPSRATSTWRSSRRSRRGGPSTASSATASRRCCGAPSRPASPRAACSPSRCA
jgi:hypothetical protein